MGSVGCWLPWGAVGGLCRLLVTLGCCRWALYAKETRAVLHNPQESLSTVTRHMVFGFEFGPKACWVASFLEGFCCSASLVCLCALHCLTALPLSTLLLSGWEISHGYRGPYEFGGSETGSGYCQRTTNMSPLAFDAGTEAFRFLFHFWVLLQGYSIYCFCIKTTSGPKSGGPPPLAWQSTNRSPVMSQVSVV